MKRREEKSDAAILHRRAARYAAQPEGISGALQEAIRFRRGESVYALPLGDLREVRPMARMSHLPGAFAIVPGVVHYRGELMSVHDLGAYFGGHESRNPAAWMVVVDTPVARLALLADAVLDTVSYAADGLLDIPVTMGEKSECLTGLLQDGTLILHTPLLCRNAGFMNAY